MKIYISGAITGTDDYMERFAKAEKELTEQGYSVINPAKVNAQLPEDTSYEEYNGGWIPCSERLPEECTEVLVSAKEIDGSFYTRTSWVQDGVWVIKKTPLQPTVIAWQPLPEPYKERD